MTRATARARTPSRTTHDRQGGPTTTSTRRTGTLLRAALALSVTLPALAVAAVMMMFGAPDIRVRPGCAAALRPQRSPCSGPKGGRSIPGRPGAGPYSTSVTTGASAGSHRERVVPNQPPARLGA